MADRSGRIEVTTEIDNKLQSALSNMKGPLLDLIQLQHQVNKSTDITKSRLQALKSALNTGSGASNEYSRSSSNLVKNQAVLAAHFARTAQAARQLNQALASTSGTTQATKATQAYIKQLEAQKAISGEIMAFARRNDYAAQSRALNSLATRYSYAGNRLTMGLTLPLATFFRTSFANYRRLEVETVRTTKLVSDAYLRAAEVSGRAGHILAQDGLSYTKELNGTVVRVQTLEGAMKDLGKELDKVSMKYGIARELVQGLSGDYAELGISETTALSNLVDLTAATEKLGNVDIAQSQEFIRSMYQTINRVRRDIASKEGRPISFKNAQEEAEFYGKTIEELRGQLAMFNLVENKTSLSLQDLAKGFPELSAAATTFGLSMTESASLLAPMVASGFQLGASANSVKVSLQRLVDMTKENSELIQVLKNNYKDFNVEAGVGVTTIQKLADSYNAMKKGSLGEKGTLQFFASVFGVRQGPRMEVAIQNLAQFQDQITSGLKAFEEGALERQTVEGNIAKKIEEFIKIRTANLTGADSAYKDMSVKTFEDFTKIVRLSQLSGSQNKAVAKAFTGAREDLAKFIKAESDKGNDLIGKITTEAGRVQVVGLLGGGEGSQAALTYVEELNLALDTAENRYQRARESLKAIGRELVPMLDSVLKAILPILQNVTEFIQKMPKWVKSGAMLGLIMLAVAGPIMKIVGALTQLNAGFRSVLASSFGFRKIGSNIHPVSTELALASDALFRFKNKIVEVGGQLYFQGTSRELKQMDRYITAQSMGRVRKAEAIAKKLGIDKRQPDYSGVSDKLRFALKEKFDPSGVGGFREINKGKKSQELPFAIQTSRIAGEKIGEAFLEILRLNGFDWKNLERTVRRKASAPSKKAKETVEEVVSGVGLPRVGKNKGPDDDGGGPGGPGSGGTRPPSGPRTGGPGGGAVAVSAEETKKASTEAKKAAASAKKLEELMGKNLQQIIESINPKSPGAKNYLLDITKALGIDLKQKIGLTGQTPNKAKAGQLKTALLDIIKTLPEDVIKKAEQTIKSIAMQVAETVANTNAPNINKAKSTVKKTSAKVTQKVVEAQVKQFISAISQVMDPALIAKLYPSLIQSLFPESSVNKSGSATKSGFRTPLQISEQPPSEPTSLQRVKENLVKPTIFENIRNYPASRIISNPEQMAVNVDNVIQKGYDVLEHNKLALAELTKQIVTELNLVQSKASQYGRDTKVFFDKNAFLAIAQKLGITLPNLFQEMSALSTSNNGYIEVTIGAIQKIIIMLTKIGQAHRSLSPIAGNRVLQLESDIASLFTVGGLSQPRLPITTQSIVKDQSGLAYIAQWLKGEVARMAGVQPIETRGGDFVDRRTPEQKAEQEKEIRTNQERQIRRGRAAQNAFVQRQEEISNLIARDNRIKRLITINQNKEKALSKRFADLDKEIETQKQAKKRFGDEAKKATSSGNLGLAAELQKKAESAAAFERKATKERTELFNKTQGSFIKLADRTVALQNESEKLQQRLGLLQLRLEKLNRTTVIGSVAEEARQYRLAGGGYRPEDARNMVAADRTAEINKSLGTDGSVVRHRRIIDLMYPDRVIKQERKALTTRVGVELKPSAMTEQRAAGRGQSVSDMRKEGIDVAKQKAQEIKRIEKEIREQKLKADDAKRYKEESASLQEVGQKNKIPKLGSFKIYERLIKELLGSIEAQLEVAISNLERLSKKQISNIGGMKRSFNAAFAKVLLEQNTAKDITANIVSSLKPEASKPISNVAGLKGSFNTAFAQALLPQNEIENLAKIGLKPERIKQVLRRALSAIAKDLEQSAAASFGKLSKQVSSTEKSSRKVDAARKKLEIAQSRLAIVEARDEGGKKPLYTAQSKEYIALGFGSTTRKNITETLKQEVQEAQQLVQQSEAQLTNERATLQTLDEQYLRLKQQLQALGQKLGITLKIKDSEEFYRSKATDTDIPIKASIGGGSTQPKEITVPFKTKSTARPREVVQQTAELVQAKELLAQIEKASTAHMFLRQTPQSFGGLGEEVFGFSRGTEMPNETRKKMAEYAKVVQEFEKIFGQLPKNTVEALKVLTNLTKEAENAVKQATQRATVTITPAERLTAQLVRSRSRRMGEPQGFSDVTIYQGRQKNLARAVSIMEQPKASRSAEDISFVENLIKEYEITKSKVDKTILSNLKFREKIVEGLLKEAVKEEKKIQRQLMKIATKALTPDISESMRPKSLSAAVQSGATLLAKINEEISSKMQLSTQVLDSFLKTLQIQRKGLAEVATRAGNLAVDDLKLLMEELKKVGLTINKAFENPAQSLKQLQAIKFEKGGEVQATFQRLVMFARDVANKGVEDAFTGTVKRLEAAASRAATASSVAVTKEPAKKTIVKGKISDVQTESIVDALRKYNIAFEELMLLDERTIRKITEVLRKRGVITVPAKDLKNDKTKSINEIISSTFRKNAEQVSAAQLVAIVEPLDEAGIRLKTEAEMAKAKGSSQAQAAGAKVVKLGEAVAEVVDAVTDVVEQATTEVKEKAKEAKKKAASKKKKTTAKTKTETTESFSIEPTSPTTPVPAPATPQAAPTIVENIVRGVESSLQLRLEAQIFRSAARRDADRRGEPIPMGKQLLAIGAGPKIPNTLDKTFEYILNSIKFFTKDIKNGSIDAGRGIISSAKEIRQFLQNFIKDIAVSTAVASKSGSGAGKKIRTAIGSVFNESNVSKINSFFDKVTNGLSSNVLFRKGDFGLDLKQATGLKLLNQGRLKPDQITKLLNSLGLLVSPFETSVNKAVQSITSGSGKFTKTFDFLASAIFRGTGVAYRSLINMNRVFATSLGAIAITAGEATVVTGKTFKALGQGIFNLGKTILSATNIFVGDLGSAISKVQQTAASSGNQGAVKFAKRTTFVAEKIARFGKGGNPTAQIDWTTMTLQRKIAVLNGIILVGMSQAVAGISIQSTKIMVSLGHLILKMVPFGGVAISAAQGLGKLASSIKSFTSTIKQSGLKTATGDAVRAVPAMLMNMGGKNPDGTRKGIVGGIMGGIGAVGGGLKSGLVGGAGTAISMMSYQFGMLGMIAGPTINNIIMSLSRIPVVGMPILLIIGSIIGVFVLLKKTVNSWSQYSNGAVEKFKKAWESLKIIIGTLIAPFADFFTSLFGGSKKAEDGTKNIGEGIGKIADWVQKTMPKIQEFVEKYVVPALYMYLEGVKLIISAMISLGKFVGNIIGAIVKLFKGDFSGAWKSVKSAMGNLGDAIGKIFKGLITILRPVINFIIDIFAKMVVGVVNLLEQIPILFINMWRWGLKIFTKLLFAGIIQPVVFIVDVVLTAFSKILQGLVLIGKNIVKFFTNVWFSIAKGAIDLFGKIPFLGGVFDGLKKKVQGFQDSVNGAIDSAANSATGAISKLEGVGNKLGKVVSGAQDAIFGAIDNTADAINSVLGSASNIVAMGANGLKNLIKGFVGDGTITKGAGKKITKDIVNAFKDPEAAKAMGELISNATKEATKSLQENFFNSVIGNLSDAIGKMKSELSEILNKQKEEYLQAYDDQIAAIDALAEAEQRLTATEEYEAAKRKRNRDRELNRQNYEKNRALAIYEGRIDDARQLDLEESKAISDFKEEEKNAETGRSKDLQAQNREDAKATIAAQKESISKLMDEAIKEFEAYVDKVGKDGTISREQLEGQWKILSAKAKETAGDLYKEFKSSFEKMPQLIKDNLDPASADNGYFSTSYDKLIETAKTKFGIGTSESGDSSTLLGLTRLMLTNQGSAITDAFSPGGAIQTGYSDGLKSLNTYIQTKNSESGSESLGGIFAKAIADANETARQEALKGAKGLGSAFAGIVKLINDEVKKITIAEAVRAAIEQAKEEVKNATSSSSSTGATGGSASGGEDQGYIAPNGTYWFRERRTAKDKWNPWIKAPIDRQSFMDALINKSYTKPDLIQISLYPKLINPNLPSIAGGAGGGGRITTSFKGGAIPYGNGGPTFGPMHQGIPAVLHGGEYVVRKSAVDKYGSGMLQSINQGTYNKTKGFFNGGMIPYGKGGIVDESRNNIGGNVGLKNILANPKTKEHMARVLPKKKEKGLFGKIVDKVSDITRPVLNPIKAATQGYIMGTAFIPELIVGLAGAVANYIPGVGKSQKTGSLFDQFVKNPIKSTILGQFFSNVKKGVSSDKKVTTNDLLGLKGFAGFLPKMKYAEGAQENIAKTAPVLGEQLPFTPGGILANLSPFKEGTLPSTITQIGGDVAGYAAFDPTMSARSLLKGTAREAVAPVRRPINYLFRRSTKALENAMNAGENLFDIIPPVIPPSKIGTAIAKGSKGAVKGAKGTKKVVGTFIEEMLDTSSVYPSFADRAANALGTAFYSTPTSQHIYELIENFANRKQYAELWARLYSPRASEVFNVPHNPAQFYTYNNFIQKYYGEKFIKQKLEGTFFGNLKESLKGINMGGFGKTGEMDYLINQTYGIGPKIKSYEDFFEEMNKYVKQHSLKQMEALEQQMLLDAFPNGAFETRIPASYNTHREFIFGPMPRTPEIPPLPEIRVDADGMPILGDGRFLDQTEFSFLPRRVQERLSNQSAAYRYYTQELLTRGDKSGTLQNFETLLRLTTTPTNLLDRMLLRASISGAQMISGVPFMRRYENFFDLARAISRSTSRLPNEIRLYRGLGQVDLTSPLLRPLKRGDIITHADAPLRTSVSAETAINSANLMTVPNKKSILMSLLTPQGTPFFGESSFLSEMEILMSPFTKIRVEDVLDSNFTRIIFGKITGGMDFANFDINDFKKISPQLGGNPGGIFEDAGGVRYYIKEAQNQAAALNEEMAARLYEMIGIRTVGQRMARGVDGKSYIISVMQDLKKINPAEMVAGMRTTEDIMKQFVFDALFGNYDVIGGLATEPNLQFIGSRYVTGYTNNPQNLVAELIRVDTGGSLYYRGTSGLKISNKHGIQFGNNANEMDALFTPYENHPSFRNASAFYSTILDNIRRAGLESSTYDQMMEQEALQLFASGRMKDLRGANALGEQEFNTPIDLYQMIQNILKTMPIDMSGDEMLRYSENLANILSNRARSIQNRLQQTRNTPLGGYNMSRFKGGLIPSFAKGGLVSKNKNFDFIEYMNSPARMSDKGRDEFNWQFKNGGFSLNFLQRVWQKETGKNFSRFSSIEDTFKNNFDYGTERDPKKKGFGILPKNHLQIKDRDNYASGAFSLRQDVWKQWGGKEFAEEAWMASPYAQAVIFNRAYNLGFRGYKDNMDKTRKEPVPMMDFHKSALTYDSQSFMTDKLGEAFKKYWTSKKKTISRISSMDMGTQFVKTGSSGDRPLVTTKNPLGFEDYRDKLIAEQQSKMSNTGSTSKNGIDKTITITKGGKTYVFNTSPQPVAESFISPGMKAPKIPKNAKKTFGWEKGKTRVRNANSPYNLGMQGNLGAFRLPDDAWEWFDMATLPLGMGTSKAGSLGARFVSSKVGIGFSKAKSAIAKPFKAGAGLIAKPFKAVSNIVKKKTSSYKYNQAIKKVTEIDDLEKYKKIAADKSLSKGMMPDFIPTITEAVSDPYDKMVLELFDELDAFAQLNAGIKPKDFSVLMEDRRNPSENLMAFLRAKFQIEGIIPKEIYDIGEAQAVEEWLNRTIAEMFPSSDLWRSLNSEVFETTLNQQDGVGILGEVAKGLAGSMNKPPVPKDPRIVLSSKEVLDYEALMRNLGRKYLEILEKTGKGKKGENELLINFVKENGLEGLMNPIYLRELPELLNPPSTWSADLLQRVLKGKMFNRDEKPANWPKKLPKWIRDFYRTQESDYAKYSGAYEKVLPIIGKDLELRDHWAHEVQATTFPELIDELLKINMPKTTIPKPRKKIINKFNPFNIFKKAYGGKIGGLSDTAVPAILHGGEYVINKRSVDQYGVQMLQNINQGIYKGARQYKVGGYVSSIKTPEIPKYTIPMSTYAKMAGTMNVPSSIQSESTHNYNFYVDNFIGETEWFNSMMKEYNMKVVPANQKQAGLESRVIKTYNGINRGL